MKVYFSQIPAKVLALIGNFLLRAAYQMNLPSPQTVLDQEPVQGDGASSEAIVVVTHSKRFFSSALPLLKQLSALELWPITLVINGDFPRGGFDKRLRSQFLREATALAGVYPVCVGTGRSPTYLWNTGIRMSHADRVLILGDDNVLDSGHLLTFVRECFKRLDFADLVIANGSFGHFSLRREIFEKIGWFDELFLGFGEEDGDFVWRAENHSEVKIDRFQSPGLMNVSSEIGFEEFAKGKGKYSLMNEILADRFIYRVDDSGPDGMFEVRKTRIRQIPDYYPGDSIFRALAHLSNEANAAKVSTELDAYFSNLRR